MKYSHLLLLCTLVIAVIIILSNRSKITTRVQKEVYGKNKFAGKYYSIRGFQMYAEVYGSGEPLLLIHGNGGSINAFYKQIPYFSKHYQVIVADSRAQGKSVDTSSDSLTYEMMADDYAALLTAMQIDSAYVLGWSDGGINGLLLAIRHPEKVKKLAITGANLQPDSTAVDKVTIAETSAHYLAAKQSFSENNPKTPEEVKEFKLLKLMIEQPNIELTALHKIAAPTLVIGGDHDLILPAHTLQIFQNIPNAYLWIIPHSGHSTLIDHADEFNKKVDAFFKDAYKKIEKKDNEF
jgi:pimeloyl-ACP methyl ester carboxylesterase